MALTTTVVASIKAQETNPLDLGTATYQLDKSFKLTLANGTGALQASKVFGDSRNIAISGTDNLDLAGGVTSAFGVVTTFTTVKAIFIVAKDTNVNDVIIGGGAATAMIGPFGANTHTVQLKPGQSFLITAGNTGWAVTAATADILKIANSGAGTAVDYDVVIVGT